LFIGGNQRARAGGQCEALKNFLESRAQGSTIVSIFEPAVRRRVDSQCRSWRWGFTPYITASNYLQLLTPLIPQLQELQKRVSRP